MGVRALPILALITFFIGLILALQSAYELRRFGAMDLVATAVAVSMTRELGPLITAIVVIGRSGSAFAAEIGTMNVTEEIDALETMAISPVSISGGAEISRDVHDAALPDDLGEHDGNSGRRDVSACRRPILLLGATFETSVDSLFMRDIITGLIKSVMFGITITAVGCFEGLYRRARARNKSGRSTTRAVVMSIFMVVIVDLVFTAVVFLSWGCGIGGFREDLRWRMTTATEMDRETQTRRRWCRCAICASVMATARSCMG